MDAGIRAQWAAALRSGEYKQTTGRLNIVKADRAPDGRLRGAAEGPCCLGVLCEVAVKAGAASYADFGDGLGDRQTVRAYGPAGLLPNGPASWEVTSNPESNSALLPEAIADWAGLASTSPEWDDPETGEMECLTEMNDGKGKSFEEIADAIEAYL